MLSQLGQLPQGEASSLAQACRPHPTALNRLLPCVFENAKVDIEVLLAHATAPHGIPTSLSLDIFDLAEWILDIKWPIDLASALLCPTQRLGSVADFRLPLADR